jgi:hypothetical protein
MAQSSQTNAQIHSSRRFTHTSLLVADGHYVTSVHDNTPFSLDLPLLVAAM